MEKPEKKTVWVKLPAAKVGGGGGREREKERKKNNHNNNHNNKQKQRNKQTTTTTLTTKEGVGGKAKCYRLTRTIVIIKAEIFSKVCQLL